MGHPKLVTQVGLINSSTICFQCGGSGGPGLANAALLVCWSVGLLVLCNASSMPTSNDCWPDMGGMYATLGSRDLFLSHVSQWTLLRRTLCSSHVLFAGMIGPRPRLSPTVALGLPVRRIEPTIFKAPRARARVCVCVYLSYDDQAR